MCLAVSYASGLYDGWDEARVVRSVCIKVREANTWVKIYYIM